VKIWTSILVAGAILAFAAPTGYSAIPWDTQSGPDHQTTRLAGTSRPLIDKTATIKALRAQNKALAARVKVLSAENETLRAAIYASQPSVSSSGTTDSASTGSFVQVLGCVSSADPVQTIDYPNSYDWSC
jgi:hypothetical protein